MISIIICGGSGTRLYPASTDFLPKQFLNIFDGKTLLEKTIDRLLFLNSKKIILVSSEKYTHLIEKIIEKYEDTSIFNVVSEPSLKNTGPAIILGLLSSSTVDDEILIVPSDHHLISSEFSQAVEKARFYKDFGIVVFGKTPTYPETGFGYISHYRNHVTQFVEKPPKNVALALIEKGGLWNMGCFFSTRKIFLSEIEKLAPSQLNLMKSFISEKNNFYYKSLDSQPFDKMIMEKTQNGYCVEYSGEWSDLGNWKDVSLLLEKSIINLDCDDIFIKTKYPIKVSKSNGVSVVYDDESYADVKDIIPLNKKGFILKPWGWIQKLLVTENYVVSKIVLFPGMRTSLQIHTLRNERITVLCGRGELLLGDTKYNLNVEDNHLIPGGSLHRIFNSGSENLILIEIQSGICDEEDITRIEDDFGR